MKLEGVRLKTCGVGHLIMKTVGHTKSICLVEKTHHRSDLAEWLYR
jgi:hypothetical protein